MTTTSLPRTYASSPAFGAAAVPGGALAVGAGLVLGGLPAWSILPYGALLLWGVREAAAPLSQRRVLGHAVALIALSCVLQVSLPRFLSPAMDYLLIVVLTGGPLLWAWIVAPGVRRALRLRRPRPSDFVWLGACFVLARGVGLGTVAHGASDAPTSELVALTVLVLLLPVVDEAIYRGLLMRASGDSPGAVLGVALVGGLAIVPAYGLLGLVAVTAIGTLLGFVRRTTGCWQTALSAHWGIALGLAAPLLMATGVTR